MTREKKLLMQASSALREIRKTYVLDVDEHGYPNASILDILALWQVVGELIEDIHND